MRGMDAAARRDGAYKIAPQPRHLALRPLRGGAVGVAQVAVVVAVGEENVERGGDSDEQPDGCATRPRLEESDGAKVQQIGNVTLLAR